MSDLRVAIVGYGLSGRFFHAPLIAATDGLKVSFVVSSSPQRCQQVASEHPDARVFPDVGELWAQTEPDLVVVATPNSSHVEIACAAIDHGIPVVVDKPMAITANAAEALMERAVSAGVMLTVFQNRRWDTDQLTLGRLMAEGALGDITRYESRFERWRPEADETNWRESDPPEQGGGVLLDLGSHLVDQALTLFGPATHLYAEIASRRHFADDDAFIALRHASGTLSHLHASSVTPSPGPRLRVQGTSAAFLVPTLDPQEAALRQGLRPNTVTDWGRTPEWEHGRLIAGERSVPVPPEPGNWPRFYALLRDAVANGGPPPVAPADAVAALRVLDAARLAAGKHQVVTV